MDLETGSNFLFGYWDCISQISASLSLIKTFQVSTKRVLLTCGKTREVSLAGLSGFGYFKFSIRTASKQIVGGYRFYVKKSVLIIFKIYFWPVKNYLNKRGFGIFKMTSIQAFICKFAGDDNSDPLK